MRTALRRYRRLARWQRGLLALVGALGAAGSGLVALTLYSQAQSNSARIIQRWFNDPSSRACPIRCQATGAAAY